MPDAPKVAELFQKTARRLRADFEAYREGSFHSAQMGAEVETILRRFLNEHLPRRFAAASAFLVDSEDNASKQCDVAIYDALNSPVLRSSDVQQILPIDHVAAVVEVKSSLNKTSIIDAYKNIASCKRLKKATLSAADRAPTGSAFSTIGTLGIVFGFDSDTSLRTLAENARDINGAYPSGEWPDFIVVLDKGTICYTMQNPWETTFSGILMPPAAEDFNVPPAFHNLSFFDDGPLTLNRFFMLLLSHLTFFPHRPIATRFAPILPGKETMATIVQGYQYDLHRELKTVPLDDVGTRRGPVAEYRVEDADGTVRGGLSYYTWQDGGFIIAGGVQLDRLLSLMLPSEKNMTFPYPQGQCSGVLRLSESEFREWHDRLGKLQPPANIRLVPLDS